MSAQAKAARAAMKDKAKRLASESSSKVDASDYRIPTDMHAEAKTGMRPVSKKAYKRGGAVSGEKAAERADRRPRASGGTAVANALVNRNDKDANEERDGIKHTGGLKRGGRAAKADGGDAGQMIDPRKVAEIRMKAAADRAGVSPNRFAFTGVKPGMMASAAGLKKGGEVEGSAKDKREDKAMARAHGMMMAEWEKSAADKKHDRPQRASGGKADDQFPPERGDDRPPMPARDGADSSRNSPSRPVIDLSSKLGKYAKGGAADDDGGYFSGSGRKASDAQMIRALKEHGMRHEYKNGVLHGVEEYSKGPSKLVPIGNDVKKLRDFLGYARGGAADCDRPARASGGRTKSGKTNVNIVIATGQPRQGSGDMPPPSMAARPPAMPVPVPPPAAAMPPGMPPGMPAGMPMPMPRARGGRTYRSFKDMDAGALSGKGRLEKTEIQAHKR